MPVTVSVDSTRVAYLTLDRPAKRNALDDAMLQSLAEAVAEISGNDGVRAVIVRGAGGTFCAGADINDWVDPPPPLAVARAQRTQQIYAALASLPMPTVAVLEGSALGGGFELALACDLRIADADARLGLPELGLGNLPASGGLARLVDIAGLGIARHLLLSGELITGTRAANMGLVTSAHPSDRLPAATEVLVGRLLNAETTALRLAKQVLTSLETVLPAEAILAGYTAGLESSKHRKHEFLRRRAATRTASTADSASPGQAAGIKSPSKPPMADPAPTSEGPQE